MSCFLFFIPTKANSQSISGQVFANTSTTQQPDYKQAHSLEMKLISKQNKEKIIKTDENGCFNIDFDSVHDIEYSISHKGGVIKGENYKPGVISIDLSKLGVDKQYEFTVTYDKDDFDNKRDIFQHIFLYPQQHWDSGNLWFTLTCRKKPDQNKKPLLLIGGFHNENKEFGNFHEIFPSQEYDIYELNYPYDQDIPLSSWLLRDTLDFLKQVYGSDIDVVTHSKGGLLPRTLIQNKALFQKNLETYLTDNIIIPYNHNIRNLVMLAPPNFGSYQAYRIVFEKGFAFLEEHAPQRGYKSNSPGSKRLAKGNKFLFDLFIDYITNHEQYTKIPTMIIAGNNDKLAFGSTLVPETKSRQGDGFVSLLSAHLPFIENTFVINENHATIRTNSTDGKSLTKEECNYFLQPIAYFLRDKIEFIRKLKQFSKTGFRQYDPKDMNGGILLKTDTIDNYVLSLDNVIDDSDFFFLEDPGERLRLSEHTVNTNPDIYAEPPIELDPNSKNLVYFIFNRAHLKDRLKSKDKQKPISGLPPGEYFLLTYEKTRDWNATLKFWSGKPKTIIKIKQNLGKVKIFPGQFTVSSLKNNKLKNIFEQEVKVIQPQQIAQDYLQKAKSARTLDEKIELCNTSIDIDPDFSDPYLHLGAIYWKEKNDPEKALECFRKHNELCTDAETKAKVEKYIGFLEQEKETKHENIIICIKNIDSLYVATTRAIALEFNSKYDFVRQGFSSLLTNKLIRSIPRCSENGTYKYDSSKGKELKCTVYCSKHGYLENILEKHGFDLDTLKREQVYKQIQTTQSLDKKIRLYERAIYLDHDFPDSYLHLGAIYWKEKNNPKKALEYFRKHNELSADNEKKSKVQRYINLLEQEIR